MQSVKLVPSSSLPGQHRPALPRVCQHQKVLFGDDDAPRWRPRAGAPAPRSGLGAARPRPRRGGGGGGAGGGRAGSGGPGQGQGRRGPGGGRRRSPAAGQGAGGGGGGVAAEGGGAGVRGDGHGERADGHQAADARDAGPGPHRGGRPGGGAGGPEKVLLHRQQAEGPDLLAGADALGVRPPGPVADALEEAQPGGRRRPAEILQRGAPGREHNGGEYMLGRARGVEGGARTD